MNLKQKILVFLFILPCLVKAQPTQFGNNKLFNERWKFSLTDNSSYKEATFDDSSWQNVAIPHDWSSEGTASSSLASCTGYLPAGIGWYRCHFTMKDLPKAETYSIYFEGVYNRSEVYINGHLLGVRPNGYISFLYDMTPYLNKKGDNVLAVRVDHSRNADSRFYTGSGIYRNVWLVAAPETRLVQWGLSYELVSVSGSDAQVDVIATTTPIKEAGYALYTELKDDEGTIVSTTSSTPLSVGGNTTNRIRISVKNFKRWDISNPYLYNLTAHLTKKGKEVCKGTVKAGFREIAFDANNGFSLNGKNMKLKGVCLHHDFGVLGSAAPKDVWRRRLENLKKLGVNAIRTSHNPENADFYDLCDELGLLVMDEAFDEWEFPKRKWLEGWNVGTPGYDGTFDFFEEWSSRDVSDMVLRDRSHASIIMWSIGNEVDYPNDPYSHPILNGSQIHQPMYGGYDEKRPNAERIGIIGKRLAKTVRDIDKSRPVTGALAGVIMSNETEYPGALDIVGYNYTEDRYDMDHEKYPQRVIYGSENGMDFSAWKACRDRDFIFGQFLWTGADYLGESGRWPSRGLGTGLLDFCSLPKPRGKFRESLWSDKPMIYIGTHPIMPGDTKTYSIDALDDWNYFDGMIVRVMCYTNAPKARLLLNGKEIGETKPYDDTKGMITWDVDYIPGVLSAEALNDKNEVVAVNKITTFINEVNELRVTPDKKKLKKGEVAHVMIEALDSKGNVVTFCKSDVKCSVGNGLKLLGIETSSNTDMSNMKNDHRNMYRGRLMAYVMATKNNAKVKLDVTSDLSKEKK